MPKVYQNNYKELSTLEYQQTSVDRGDVRAYIDTTDYPVEVKIGTMTFIQNETSCVNGINNNFGGIQADGNRWASKWNVFFTGVVYKQDHTGSWRWFLAFDTWQHCVDFMLENTKKRGVYWGGFAIPYARTLIVSVDTFITAYYKEWVEGEHTLSSPIPTNEYSTLRSIYNQEYKYFSQSIQKKNQQLQELLSSAIDNSRYNIRFFLLGK